MQVVTNYKFEFEAIGTHWVIDILDNTHTCSKLSKDELLRSINALIDEFDKNFSRFRQDSLITQISKREGLYMMPAYAEPLFTTYKQLYDLTQGLFTPLIGNVLVDAGYDAKYSFVPNKLTTPLKWNDTLEYNHPELLVKQKVVLDFGAGGKGFLVDLVAEHLIKSGFETFIVDAGGDISYKSLENIDLKIGLENPKDPDQVIGIAYVKNASICSSAGNRRKWHDFHHIINPKTLSSPEEILCAWTISDTTFIADSIATCLFFVQPDIIEKEYDFEYLILYSDFSIKKSPGFQAELFYA